MLTASQVLDLVKGGEGYNVDLKRSVPSKVKEISDEVVGFANASGGYVLIGVDNDNQIIGAKIDNNKRSAIQDTIGEISPAIRCDMYSVEVEGKKVWVIDVPSGKDKPYITGGLIYVREGANCQKLRTAEEIRAFFAECSKIFYDAIPCRWFDIEEDIERHNFKSFLEKAHLSEDLPIRQLFDNLELMTDDGRVKNAAALFFGKEPERKFPHAIVRCLRFKGLDQVHIIDDKTLAVLFISNISMLFHGLRASWKLSISLRASVPERKYGRFLLTHSRRPYATPFATATYTKRVQLSWWKYMMTEWKFPIRAVFFLWWPKISERRA